MNRIVVSFAAALMLGGSTAALAQQGKEGGGRPDSPGQSQAAPGQAAQGAGPAARGDRPGRSEARDGIGPQEQGRGGDRGAERRAQGKQDAPGRSSEGKQDRDRQAQDKQKQDRDRQAQDKQKQDRDRQAQDKQAPAGKGDRSDTATGPRADGARPDRVELSDNQRERVRREFREHRQRTNARHYRNVDVDIGVGRRAPRNWNYHPVPSFIIDVQPRYRGYRYVWVDDRYYIVHPSSYEIVAYVDDDSGYVYASGGRVGSSATGRGGGEAGRAGRCEVSLNEAERRRIIAAIDDWNPRPYQLPAWEEMEQGCKRNVIVWHRRAGKDAFAIHWTKHPSSLRFHHKFRGWSWTGSREKMKSSVTTRRCSKSLALAHAGRDG